MKISELPAELVKACAELAGFQIRVRKNAYFLWKDRKLGWFAFGSEEEAWGAAVLWIIDEGAWLYFDTKNQKLYRVSGAALSERGMMSLCVDQGPDGVLWVWPTHEFTTEGRFVKVVA